MREKTNLLTWKVAKGKNRGNIKIGLTEKNDQKHVCVFRGPSSRGVKNQKNAKKAGMLKCRLKGGRELTARNIVDHHKRGELKERGGNSQKQ